MADIPKHTSLSTPAPTPEQSDRPSHVRPRKRPETRTQQFFRPIRRNRFWLLLYLWAAVALPELTLHCAAALSWRALFSPGLMLGPLFALAPALVFFILCTALPRPRVSYWISVGYSAAALTLCGSQLVYYRIFGTFYTVRSLRSGASLFQLGSTILAALRGCLPWLLFMALPWIFLLVFGRMAFSFKPLKQWKGHIPMAVACVAVQLLTVLILPIFGGTGDTTAYGLYHKASDSYLSVNKLGLFTAMRLDLARTMTGKHASGTIVIQAPVLEETSPQPTAAPGSTETVPSAPHPVSSGPNILDIDFDALAAAEKNPDIADVHAFFASRTASLKNEKTGVFKDCNLILITADGLSDLAVSDAETPTLYKMTHQGFHFTNYYVPNWGVSSTDGEYALLTGAIPKSDEESFKASMGSYLPLTMAQQLIPQGYSSYAYYSSIGHDTQYRKGLENLGYECQTMGGEMSAPEVMDQSAPEYAGDTPFSVYYVLLADTLELENAIKLLLERLDAAGVLENTVIVLTAGNAPTGLNQEEHFEFRKSGCVIWKQGMEPETIDAATSDLDILPTLSNLFGLEFDSRLYMGRDVFSDAKPFVCFRSRSWITDLAMYNAETGAVTSLTNQAVANDYVNFMNTEVSNRLTVSARILEKNYWKILFG